MHSRLENSIDIIRSEILDHPSSWILGYSGGKDSTALLILAIRAIESLKKIPSSFKLIVTYCDTGVDIPTVRLLTKKHIQKFQAYCSHKKIPVEFKISRPRLEDRFFVKVIGRGYVPPTNKFRWCTDRLRIMPVERLIQQHYKKASRILLGIRSGESMERDKIIHKHRRSAYTLIQGSTKRTIFAPILNLNVTDVWNVIVDSDEILGGVQLSLLAQYRNASGECPLVRDPRSSPCSQGRFGCWTCTVIRKDKSVTNLIESGQINLKPLLEFRNWLSEIRDQSQYRESYRRNGTKGPGPFKVEARKEILRQLRRAEKKSGYRLILASEIRQIGLLWKQDLGAPKKRGPSPPL